MRRDGNNKTKKAQRGADSLSEFKRSSAAALRRLKKSERAARFIPAVVMPRSSNPFGSRRPTLL